MNDNANYLTKKDLYLECCQLDWQHYHRDAAIDDAFGLSL